MKNVEEYIDQIAEPQHQNKMKEIIDWTIHEFPTLQAKIAWNQPMFTDHGTFIIGFSMTKKHIAAAPERAGLEYILDDLELAGYSCTKELFRIKWNQEVDYALLRKVIAFNIAEKKRLYSFLAQIKSAPFQERILLYLLIKPPCSSCS